MEKAIEQYLIEAVEARGGLCVKFIPSLFAGFPDRILIMPRGITMYVELKAPNIKKPSPLQRLVQNKLRRRDHIVEVCNSEELIDALMFRYDFYL